MTIKKRAAKKPIDYKQGKVYKIVNDVNDMVYVGSTVNELTKRFSTHKCTSKTENSKFYTAMREIGKEHFRIILIELSPCTCKAELEAREYELTNALDKAKLYNSAFDGKPTALNVAKLKEAVFNRGCISHSIVHGKSSGFTFIWREGGLRHSKTYAYPTKRTKEQAYMLCVAMRDEIYPLTNKDYLQELPFAE